MKEKKKIKRMSKPLDGLLFVLDKCPSSLLPPFPVLLEQIHWPSRRNLRKFIGIPPDVTSMILLSFLTCLSSSPGSDSHSCPVHWLWVQGIFLFIYPFLSWRFASWSDVAAASPHWVLTVRTPAQELHMVPLPHYTTPGTVSFPVRVLSLCRKQLQIGIIKQHGGLCSGSMA